MCYVKWIYVLCICEDDELTYVLCISEYILIIFSFVVTIEGLIVWLFGLSEHE
jgi:hypothetical protein